MKMTVLMENTACAPELRCAHGLSLYFETPKHKILFDAGPNGDMAANADALGVDLSQVDIAVLSHGHSDHSDGLPAFFARNDRAKVYVRPAVWEGYYACRPTGTGYIGLDPALEAYRDRFVAVEGVYAIDEELTLFPAAGDFPTADTDTRLRWKNPAGDLVPDTFGHEQDLLISAEGKTVLVAGCAHRGIVNICHTAERLTGRAADAVVGGFHLFQLDPEKESSGKLLQSIGRALLPGETVYYTGHCTGEYAFGALRDILGDRLRGISTGMEIDL
ncbi:MBL fold metallo-hydrolase [Dysosmobacter sp.]|uniref:MBL fold metallo-hydrolase n=1 Tax=Dysosmobacter sp. TaxID=2591382 RepID=UPI002A8633D3|nr:MBL fold metallo-hydrolase [Dysosmobacter sp.]MDY3280780.1 MBL fold metallo-hydrolase [Dysosmobacter sp.]